MKAGGVADEALHHILKINGSSEEREEVSTIVMVLPLYFPQPLL